MKKISNNLFVATGRGLFWVPIFILPDSKGDLTLIDTGLKKDVKFAMKQVVKKWGSIEKIKRIVFTHRHMDHVGGLEYIIDEIKKINPNHQIEIACHKDEAPYFKEDIKRVDLHPNRLIEHEEMIDEELGIRGVHVPGHTFGHLCILLEKGKIMLFGDVIIWIFGGLKQVMERVHDDWLLSQKSLNIILNYNWDVGIPSHFKLKQIPRKQIKDYIIARFEK